MNVDSMKDYLPVSPCMAWRCVAIEAYGELPAAPETLNDSQLIEGHGCKDDLGAVGVAELPCEEAPYLPIVEQVRPGLDPEVVFGVSQAGQERRRDHADDQRLRHRSVGEARGDHGGGITRPAPTSEVCVDFLEMPSKDKELKKRGESTGVGCAWMPGVGASSCPRCRESGRERIHRLVF